MATILSLREKYENLDGRITARQANAIDAECLLAFDYEYRDQPTEVSIDTDEFTALCPWTDLPDYGILTITYMPRDLCVELKSLKYYLLSYRDVGIVQEHAANRVLQDLVCLCRPWWMKVVLNYKIRGGLHTSVNVDYGDPSDPESHERQGATRG